MVLGKIQLVVSRLFAGDNRLSLDILLVTTGCHQTKKSGDNRLSADLANVYLTNIRTLKNIYTKLCLFQIQMSLHRLRIRVDCTNGGD